MRFEDFLIEHLGQPKTETDGEIMFDCPFCSDKRHRFGVKVSLDDKNGLWQCFNCGETGNPISFVKKFYNVNGKEAIDLLDKNNIDIEIDKTIHFDNSLTESEKLILLLYGSEKENERNKKTPPPLPLNYKFLSDNMNNQEAKPFIDYLHSRNVTNEQIRKYNIAYTTHSKCYKKDNETLFDFYNSIIFFTFNSYGQYVYWNTRTIYPTKMKTINAPNNENQYGKKDVIFNFNIAKYQPFIIITEGVFDALTFDKYGVATFGKAISEEQIEMIIKHVPKDTVLFLMLDKDAYEYNVETASILYKHFPNTYVVPQTDKDANDLGTKKALELIKNNKILATPEGLNNYLLKQKLLF